jgi:hypothetical protein
MNEPTRPLCSRKPCGEPSVITIGGEHLCFDHCNDQQIEQYLFGSNDDDGEEVPARRRQ